MSVAMCKLLPFWVRNNISVVVIIYIWQKKSLKIMFLARQQIELKICRPIRVEPNDVPTLRERADIAETMGILIKEEAQKRRKKLSFDS